MPMASARKTLEIVFGPMINRASPEEQEQFYKAMEDDCVKPEKDRLGHTYFWEKIQDSYCDFEDRIRDRIK